MIRLNLTALEAEILAALLNRAGEEFSHHGCNDFTVSDRINVTKELGEQVAKQLREKMVANKMCDAELLDQTSDTLDDWLLFRLFAKRVDLAPETRSIADLTDDLRQPLQVILSEADNLRKMPSDKSYEAIERAVARIDATLLVAAKEEG